MAQWRRQLDLSCRHLERPLSLDCTRLLPRSLGVALLAKRDMEHPRRSGLLVDADVALDFISTGTEVVLHLIDARGCTEVSPFLARAATTVLRQSSGQPSPVC